MEKLNKIIKFEIFAVIFSLIVGTLLHFTFEWSNNNYIVGAFSAVNESVWEHLKLAFFPMLITTIIGLFYLGNCSPNFLCARLKAILTSIIFITVFFYTYTGIIGINFAIIDIASFIVAILLGEYVAFRELLLNSACNKILAGISIFILLIAFILFTYFPPKLNHFKDPVTMEYGINIK